MNRSETIITRFTFRQSRKVSLIWGWVFAVMIASSAYGFILSFPDAAERTKLFLSFKDNIGVKAMLGEVYGTPGVAAFTAWRAGGVLAIIGSIWGILAAGKHFRGDEEEGRMELLRVGRVTARRSVVQIIIGLLVGMVLTWILAVVGTMISNISPDINFTFKQATYFSLALLLPALIMLSTGMLVGQIAANRRQAVGITSIIFGAFFAVRAAADTVADWVSLRQYTPLGWVEELRPLTDPNPKYLLPIFGYILIAFGLGIYLAGKRDLGEGFLKNKDSAKSKTALLKNPFTLTLRLNFSQFMGWALGIAIVGTIFGFITKTAVDALMDSTSMAQQLSKFGNAMPTLSITGFTGIIFLMAGMIIAIYATALAGSIRDEESFGYLDNLLVRKITRLNWFISRYFIAVVDIVLVGIIFGFAIWNSLHYQGVDVVAKDFVLAGINMIVPVFLAFGLAILTFGLKPRLTMAVGYIIISSSFLIQFIAPFIKNSDWLMHLSIFNYTTAAPAVAPDWRINTIIAGWALLASLIGLWGFLKRDITGE